MSQTTDIKIQNAPVKLASDSKDDYDVTGDDLEILESRIEEIERYLGIQDMDLDYFYKEQGEDLNQKSQMLVDFMQAAEDKLICLKDLYTRYEKMESFLKKKEPFIEQCMDLKRKNNFIIEQIDQLQAFLKLLEEIKSREKLLVFDPITESYQKLEEIGRLKKVHCLQMIASERQAEEVEESLIAYNQIVESISDKIRYLQSQM